MPNVTIMKIGSVLIVPIQVELHDRAAVQLQEDILRNVERREAKGLLIDVSRLQLVDSFMARLLGDTAAMASLMGCEAVVVGLQPPVAVSLMELGVPLGRLYTALNVEEGLSLLERLTGEKRFEPSPQPTGTRGVVSDDEQSDSTN